MTYNAVGYKLNVNESKIYTIYDVFKQKHTHNNKLFRFGSFNKNVSRGLQEPNAALALGTMGQYSIIKWLENNTTETLYPEELEL